MRAIRAIVKSIPQSQRFWDVDNIRGQARKLGRIAFIKSPPTIGIVSVICRGKIWKIALNGAFDRDIGRNAWFDRVPFVQGVSVWANDDCGLDPIGREGRSLTADGGVIVSWAFDVWVWLSLDIELMWLRGGCNYILNLPVIEASAASVDLFCAAMRVLQLVSMRKTVAKDILVKVAD